MRDDLLAKPSKPKQTTLLQIHGKLHQKSKDDSDLSLDEEADLMLKSKAHQMTTRVAKGDPHTDGHVSQPKEEHEDL